MRTNPILISLASTIAMVSIPAQTNDPGWSVKPVAEWSFGDAQEILTNSPWSHAIRASVLHEQSEDERRAGGSMGKATGIGFDGLDEVDGPRKLVNLPKSLYSDPITHSVRTPVLGIRWESALPVRAAELKAGIVEPPTISGDGYLIAVYGVPPANVQGTPERLGAPLKALALLRRPGKPDVRPIRAEVFQRDDGTTVAYLFPKWAEITKEDHSVEFIAQIGRLYAAYTFRPETMQFQGKIELF
jgi:hypothetical protein